jgi:1-deoxy-D-xylulose-5-phosphate synthase
MWDLALLGMVPGIRIAAPRDETSLRELLRESVACADGPSVVRFPKTPLRADVPALERVGSFDILHADPGADVLLVSAGALAHETLEVALRIGAEGYRATVVDPRWLTPVDPALLALAARHRLVVTLEDGNRVGGVGSRLSQALRDAGTDIPTRDIGIPPRFLAHGTVAEVRAEIGLTAQDIARNVVEWMARLEPADTPASERSDRPTQ